MVKSATSSFKTSGVLVTTMPRRAAAATSIEIIPDTEIGNQFQARKLLDQASIGGYAPARDDGGNVRAVFGDDLGQPQRVVAIDLKPACECLVHLWQHLPEAENFSLSGHRSNSLAPMARHPGRQMLGRQVDADPAPAGTVKVPSLFSLGSPNTFKSGFSVPSNSTNG